MPTLHQLDNLLSTAMATTPDPSRAIGSLLRTTLGGLIAGSGNVELISKACEAVRLVKDAAGDDDVAAQCDLLFDLITPRSVETLLDRGDARHIGRLMKDLALLHPDDRAPYLAEVFEPACVHFVLVNGDSQCRAWMEEAAAEIGEPHDAVVASEVLAHDRVRTPSTGNVTHWRDLASGDAAARPPGLTPAAGVARRAATL